MRKSFQDALADLKNISRHKDILLQTPNSPQECFLQILANLVLDTKKDEMENVLPLVEQYEGTFSQLQLIYKVAIHSIEKEKTGNFHFLIILSMLSKWVEIMENLKYKKDIRLYDEVIETLEKGIVTYEGFIIYLNYISLDLVSLLKSGSEASQKKYPDLSHYPHLTSQDLIRFLKVSLPKTLSNIIVPRVFFPATLVESTQESIDILYNNQNLENIIESRQHYCTLIKSIIKILLSMELEPSQIKDLVLCCFKYYYLFHFDKNHGASQMVIESMKKMTTAVRFAINDEILLFVVILKKLGKELFVNYLYEKFSWMNEVPKPDSMVGIQKSSIKPFHSHAFNNSYRVKVNARTIEKRYIQVYDRFSLLYFSLNCLEHDITIRFYFMGDFDKKESNNEKRLLFASDKKEGLFEGSIQAIQKGIYMFQFDNTYSWVKAKTLAYDYVLFVPLEIRQKSKNPIKQIIFEGSGKVYESQVPYESILGWVEEQKIKINCCTANITFSLENNLKVYSVKLVKNSGQIYEYETDGKLRFLQKLQKLSEDPHIFWSIEGYKVKGVVDVQKWLNGELQLEKLETIQKQQQKQKEQPQERKMVKEEQEQEQQQYEKEKQIHEEYQQSQELEKKQEKKQEEKEKSIVQPDQQMTEVPSIEENSSINLKQKKQQSKPQPNEQQGG